MKRDLFNENKIVAPKTGSLSFDERKELEIMQTAYNKYCSIDSDQKSNHLIWVENFLDKYGPIDNFLRRKKYLESNKSVSIYTENFIENALENIDVLKTLKVLHKGFLRKNIIKLKNHKAVFQKFCKTKKRQFEQKSYDIYKFLEILNIKTYEDWKNLITNPKIKEKIISGEAKFIQGEVIQKISYIPERKF